MTSRGKGHGDPRQRATARFLEILADDFDVNGQDAVEKARAATGWRYRGVAAVRASMSASQSAGKALWKEW